MRHIVAFSGGKDSTAMLLKMIDKGMKIDQIIFADTGFEQPDLYEYIERIETEIGRKVTILACKHPNPQSLSKKEREDFLRSEFRKWFYGIVTRGENKGKVRGFPLIVHPCWWMRESKVYAIEHFTKQEDTITYLGIAYDEEERVGKDSKIRYPLYEWKMTEADCVDYLNKRDLFNELYVNFDRLGCYICPKQGESSLYVIWKHYPEQWAELKFWDQETFRVKGHYIKGDVSLKALEQSFQDGYVPIRLPKYECWNGCEGVKRAFKETQCGLTKFIG